MESITKNGTRCSAFRESIPSREKDWDISSWFCQTGQVSGACTDGSNSPTVRLNRNKIVTRFMRRRQVARVAGTLTAHLDSTKFLRNLDVPGQKAWPVALSCYASNSLRDFVPVGLSSFPRSARLTPLARLPASGLRAVLATPPPTPSAVEEQAACFAVIVSRRSRASRAARTRALAASRPSSTL